MKQQVPGEKPEALNEVLGHSALEKAETQSVRFAFLFRPKSIRVFPTGLSQHAPASSFHLKLLMILLLTKKQDEVEKNCVRCKDSEQAGI